MGSRWDDSPPLRPTSTLSILGTAAGEAVWHEANLAQVEIELVGSELRATGFVEMREGHRFSDYVNLLEGFFKLRDVTLLDRYGKPTRVTLPDLRVRLDEIVVVAQRHHVDPPPPPALGHIAKQARRLVVMTGAHIIYGSAWLHEDASLTNFVDSTDPRFMPMTDVRVRWHNDRRLAGRYPFALVQRSRIMAVTTEERPVSARSG